MTLTLTDSLTVGLNAPFGARCFLTHLVDYTAVTLDKSLNAPFGARCFLTVKTASSLSASWLSVLMHLLALGAF